MELKEECIKSLEVLSEYRDGALGEVERVWVIAHLDKCPPCMELYKDLDMIVLTATALRPGEGVNFPDEDTLWQRIGVIKPVH